MDCNQKSENVEPEKNPRLDNAAGLEVEPLRVLRFAADVRMRRQGFSARDRSAGPPARRRTDSWESVDGFTLVNAGSTAGCASGGATGEPHDRAIAAMQAQRGELLEGASGLFGASGVGESVEVDGTEWIDLGCRTAGMAKRKLQEENKALQTTVVDSTPVFTVANVKPKPPVIPTDRRTQQVEHDHLQSKSRTQQETSSRAVTSDAERPMSKAEHSKEALRKFYLSRASQIAAKCKKMEVSSPSSTSLQPLRGSSRSALVGKQG